MLDIRQERMGPHMLKVHVPGLGVLHRFTQADHGDAHDHAQWGFRSTVLAGGYVEEVWHPDGSLQHVERRPGDSFEIAPEHVTGSSACRTVSAGR